MKHILTLVVFLISYILCMGNTSQKFIIPLYNASFEHWEIHPKYGYAPFGWNYFNAGYPLKFYDNRPHSGEKGLSFVQRTPITSQYYNLTAGTYVFQVFASGMDPMTLRVIGSTTDKKQIYDLKQDSGWKQYSLSFTLYEPESVCFRIENQKPWDGNSDISEFDIDDVSVETEDGSMVSAQCETIPENSQFSYYLYNDGTAELVRCIEKGIGGVVTIPDNIYYDNKKYRITTILESSFRNCSNIKEINLPKNLLTIKSGAFRGCSSLQSIALPTYLELIEDYAFEECNSLTEVELFTKQKPQIANHAFPDNQDITFYVADISDYEDNSNWKIQSLGFVADCLTYSGIIPNITVSTPKNIILNSINMNSLKASAGTYNLPATFSHENGLSINGFVTFTIEKAKLNIRANDKTRQYGLQNPSFDATYEGFVNNENSSNLRILPTIHTSANPKTDVGNYIIEVDNAKSENYDIRYLNGTLTITKAPLIAKIGYYTRKYGEQNPQFEIAYDGFFNGDDASSIDNPPTINTNATINANVGTYNLTLTGGEARNYFFNKYHNGEIQVLPASLTIIANSIERPYYSNTDLTYKCLGFVLGEDINNLTREPEIVCDATLWSNVGKYAINVKNAIADNYVISYQSGELTIYKRTLDVKAQDAKRKYGESNPELKYNITGFVNNEDENVLIQKPLIYTSANEYSDVGEYDICIVPGEAQNYNFSCINATLHIEKQAQFLTWSQDLSNLKIGDVIKLEASSSAGLHINYEILNGSAAILFTQNDEVFLKCNESGEVIICAEQNGNINYSPAEQIFRNAVILPSASINDIVVDKDRFDTYDINGNCVLHNATIEEIRNLSSGIYVIRGNGRIMKICI